MKYAAIFLPTKRIVTPFFSTTQEVDDWIDKSDCEPLNMFRMLGEEYDFIQITETCFDKLILNKHENSI